MNRGYRRSFIAFLTALTLVMPVTAKETKNGWNDAHDMYYTNGNPLVGLNAIGSDSYYFDAQGHMVKGDVLVDNKHRYFNETDGKMLVFGWASIDKYKYWYEDGIRQGVEGDHKNIIDNIYRIERGREIYDPSSDAWYWLDANNEGAMAKDKDVWIPYIFQDEIPGSSEGKWVRYTSSGAMVKGEQYYAKNSSWYYFDLQTGAMWKGLRQVNNTLYSFYDLVTGKRETGSFSWDGVDYVADGNGIITHTYIPGIPYYNQTDSRWSNTMINGLSFRNTGCVCCVATSLINYYTSSHYTPLDIAYMFNAWGDYNANYGHGTDTGVWRKVAGKYHLTFANNMSPDDMIRHLRIGEMVPTCVARGYFVGGNYTHCILLFGLDEHNRTFVYDPLSSGRNGWYSIYDIFNQQSHDWVDVIDGGPIMALGRSH